MNIARLKDGRPYSRPIVCSKTGITKYVTAPYSDLAGVYLKCWNAGERCGIALRLPDGNVGFAKLEDVIFRVTAGMRVYHRIDEKTVCLDGWVKFIDSDLNQDLVMWIHLGGDYTAKCTLSGKAAEKVVSERHWSTVRRVMVVGTIRAGVRRDLYVDAVDVIFDEGFPEGMGSAERIERMRSRLSPGKDISIDVNGRRGLWRMIAKQAYVRASA